MIRIQAWFRETVRVWSEGSRRASRRRRTFALSAERLEERTVLDSALPHLFTVAQDDFVSGIYGALLDRTPTVEEAQKLSQDMSGGTSRVDALARLLATREYDRHAPGPWLKNLYDDVLGRAPDKAGLAAWTRAAAGTAREVVARAFLNAKEFQGLVSAALAEAAATSGAPAFQTEALVTSLLVQFKKGINNGFSRLTSGGATAGATVEPTDIPGLFRVNGSESVLVGLAVSLPQLRNVLYVETEQSFSLSLTANDPKYTDNTLWGLTGAYGIGAATAWNTTTGSTKVVVADIDTGVDYNHPDLYKNIWVNQSEIPGSWLTKQNGTYSRTVSKSQVKDVDSDGKITFWDLNDAANSGLMWDNNGNGRIDAGDVLLARSQGGWEDGTDAGANGYVDDIVGWNFVSKTNKPMDDQDHGTHVAGTIGAMGNNSLGITGVNWKTQIMALKWMYPVNNGASATGYLTNASAALRYAANNGAKVSNNSWGGPGGDSTLRDAIVYAGSKGQVVVVSAGNDTKNISTNASYPAAYHLSNMIVVAAINSTGGLAGFSNYSSTLVDVGAPGVGIYSTTRNNTYKSFNGTSMAAPHVAGVVALVQAAFPSLSVAQVIGRVVNGATALASLAGKTVTGGRLDAVKALAGGGGGGGTVVVPAAPTTPAWSATNATNGILSWSAVSGATGYTVQSSTNGTSWSKYGDFGGTTANVAVGRYYRVAAVNSAGTSGYSGSVFASPPAVTIPAAPGAPSWSSAGGDTINLSWTAVAGATSYNVQWWNSSTAAWVDLGNYSVTSLSISHGLGYYWRVQAANSAGAGNYGAYTLAGQTPGAPWWNSTGGSNINLSWNSVGATNYVVQWWNSSTAAWVNLGTYGSGTTSLSINNGYNYYWRIGAVYGSSNALYGSWVLAK